jgi:hypothetical protein
MYVGCRTLRKCVTVIRVSEWIMLMPHVCCSMFVKGVGKIPEDSEMVKVNLSPCLTMHRVMKMYWESEHIAPCILNLSPRWRWVVSFMPRLLYPWCKSPPPPKF